MSISKEEALAALNILLEVICTNAKELTIIESYILSISDDCEGCLMACIEPDPNCGCAGCTYAGEVNE